MKYTQEYRDLMAELEYIVAKHCSTGGLKNGRNYRYPVTYVSKGQKHKVEGDYRAFTPLDAVTSLEYQFGNHTLEIGEALEEILNFLTENYDDISVIPTF